MTTEFIERHAWTGRGGVRKMFVPVQKKVDEKKRHIRFVVSTEAQDRDGDIVVQEGWDLEHYQKNPVVLWAHESWTPPIGRAVDIGVKDKQLVATAQFATREEHPLADTAFRLYVGGYLHAVSAGFMPTKSEPMQNEDGDFRGFRFLSSQLWEFSAVPIPSNPEALIAARSKGVDVRPAVSFIERQLDEGAGELTEHLSRVYVKTMGRVHPVVQGDLARRNVGTKGAGKSLYMHRPVQNAADIAKWAKAQGFTSTLHVADMHVTLAFSKDPVDWNAITPHSDIVTVTGGQRAIASLGENGEATVLRFESDALEARWQALRDVGCSWDWDSYKPHVTLTYSGAPDDLDQVAVYEGEIILGPEIMQEVKMDWKDDVAETDTDEEMDEDEKAQEGEVFTTEGGEDHEHEFMLGAEQTEEAGDPPHVHGIVYDEDGLAIIEDAEGHGHQAPADAVLELPEDGDDEETEAADDGEDSGDDEAEADAADDGEEDPDAEEDAMDGDDEASDDQEDAADESEDDEDDESKAAEIAALRRQIAAMSKRIDALTNEQPAEMSAAERKAIAREIVLAVAPAITTAVTEAVRHHAGRVS